MQLFAFAPTLLQSVPSRNKMLSTGVGDVAPGKRPCARNPDCDTTTTGWIVLGSTGQQMMKAQPALSLDGWLGYFYVFNQSEHPVLLSSEPSSIGSLAPIRIEPAVCPV